METEKPRFRPLKKRVSLTLDPEVLDTVQELAEEDGRSLSEYINRVLLLHIREKNKK